MGNAPKVLGHSDFWVHTADDVLQISPSCLNECKKNQIYISNIEFHFVFFVWIEIDQQSAADFSIPILDLFIAQMWAFFKTVIWIIKKRNTILS